MSKTHPQLETPVREMHLGDGQRTARPGPGQLACLESLAISMKRIANALDRREDREAAPIQHGQDDLSEADDFKVGGTA